MGTLRVVSTALTCPTQSFVISHPVSRDIHAMIGFVINSREAEQWRSWCVRACVRSFAMSKEIREGKGLQHEETTDHCFFVCAGEPSGEEGAAGERLAQHEAPALDPPNQCAHGHAVYSISPHPLLVASL